MENKNMFYRGYVELLVLKFLSEKDCYGYEIVKSIKRASKDKISLSWVLFVLGLVQWQRALYKKQPAFKPAVF